MRGHLRRTLALDVPLALLIGMASAAAARFAQEPRDLEHGPGRFGPPGPIPLGPSDVSWPLFPALALLVAATALRRVWPRAAFVGVVVGVAGYLAAGGPYGPVLLAPALAVHALASALPIQRWAPLTLLLVPMLLAGSWDQPYLGLLDPSLYGVLVTGFALLVVPAMFALLRRNRREAERLEREQELRRYAYEERLQIAREVHDVVGHSLSVINLQAGVALHVLHRRPDEVETSLEAIKRTSREALAELRTTLAVYRDPAAGPSESHASDQLLAPLPGLARLDDLLSSLRAAGREVTLQAEGLDVEAPLPAAVDQAAYRIIQEALTNVVRHADGSGASVLIRRSPAGLRVEVSDAGPVSESPVVEGSGILGMRERAQAVGGILTVGKPSTGGFRVTAELPLTLSATSGGAGASGRWGSSEAR